MSSRALAEWQRRRRTEIDRLFEAHAAVGGNDRGRRYATQQLNHAIIVAIAGQFQGFCRELYQEAAAALVKSIKPENVRPLVLSALTAGRQRDRGNAQEGSIGSDYNRLGLEFWKDVSSRAPQRTKGQRQALARLNLWRNAIVHDDFGFEPRELEVLNHRVRPRLSDARQVLTACNRLAVTFDAVVCRHLLDSYQVVL